MVDYQQEQQMSMDVVLNELDEFAGAWEAAHGVGSEQQCQRDKHRRKFRTQCDIWYFEDGGSSVKHRMAQTRNLSEAGVGILAKCVAHVGVPIEIRIAVPNRPPTHLGGIVAFCRYASRGLHEIGVALKVHQSKPIFADDPTRAASRLPWLQETLRRMVHGNRAGRHPPKTANPTR